MTSCSINITHLVNVFAVIGYSHPGSLFYSHAARPAKSYRLSVAHSTKYIFSDISRTDLDVHFLGARTKSHQSALSGMMATNIVITGGTHNNAQNINYVTASSGTS